MGYSPTQSAYLCLHIPTGRMYTSRHVRFDEQRFPFATPTSSIHDAIKNSTSHTTRQPLVLPMVLPCSVLHSPPSPPINPHQVLSPTLNSSSSSPRTEPTAPFENGLQSTIQQHEPTALTQNGPKPQAQQPQPTNNQNQTQPTCSIPSPNSPLTSSTSSTSSDTSKSTTSSPQKSNPIPSPNLVSPIRSENSPPNSSPQKSNPNPSPISTSSSSSDSHVSPPKQPQRSMATRLQHGITKPNKIYIMSAAVTLSCDIEPRTAN